jgi:hypothetical protein
MTQASFRYLTASLLFVFVAAGCSDDRKFRIGGKITHGGEPLVWKNEESYLFLVFAPVDREKHKDVYKAEFDKESCSYTVSGIPPGEYMVAIQQFDPLPGTDVLGHKYNLAKSPLRKEVTSDGQVIDIDVPRDDSPPNTPAGKGGRSKKGKKEPPPGDE